MNMQPRTLIIDDEPDVRGMLEALLAKLGHQTATASSGADGITQIKTGSFNLVLCDVMMPASSPGGPEMGGLETLTEIKKTKPDLPVLMISGVGTHDRFVEAMAQGAVDFIAKPINLLQAKKTIQRALESGNNSQETVTHLMREGYLGLLRIMIQALENKDSYTKDHSRRVAEYATKTAQAMKLDEGSIEVINYAGLLHDIGKIRISDKIIAKPGKLDAGEWAEMKMHPVVGSMIVSELKLFRAEEPLIRHHHERFDGAGYPDALKHNQIPLGARILALADTYDALTSARPYRGAMDSEHAKNIIKDNINQQFDPEVTGVFLELV